MLSLLKEIGPVTFPENTGERVYMLPFTKKEGLPLRMMRWQLTIDAMLKDVDVDGPIYLMIDQGVVETGKSHRRGGPHIDGNWCPGIKAHGSGHRPYPPGHTAGPAHGPRKNIRWDSDNFSPEALILASDVEASCAYVGEIEGEPVPGGDCSHLDLGKALKIPLKAGLAYAGNVTMIHESLPVPQTCQRTLVRLNVPGFTF
jgi:hypothetical protein